MHTIVSIIIENIWSNDYDRNNIKRCEEGITLAWNLKQTYNTTTSTLYHFKIILKKNNAESWRLEQLSGLKGGMKL